MSKHTCNIEWNLSQIYFWQKSHFLFVKRFLSNYIWFENFFLVIKLYVKHYYRKRILSKYTKTLDLLDIENTQFQCNSLAKIWKKSSHYMVLASKRNMVRQVKNIPKSFCNITATNGVKNYYCLKYLLI